MTNSEIADRLDQLKRRNRSNHASKSKPNEVNSNTEGATTTDQKNSYVQRKRNDSFLLRGEVSVRFRHFELLLRSI